MGILSHFSPIFLSFLSHFCPIFLNHIPPQPSKTPVPCAMPHPLPPLSPIFLHFPPISPHFRPFPSSPPPIPPFAPFSSISLIPPPFPHFPLFLHFPHFPHFPGLRNQDMVCVMCWRGGCVQGIGGHGARIVLRTRGSQCGIQAFKPLTSSRHPVQGLAAGLAMGLAMRMAMGLAVGSACHSIDTRSLITNWAQP